MVSSREFCPTIWPSPAGVAQSAEHGHGKSGVGGSIPASSSPRRRLAGLPAVGTLGGPGGVAQRQSKRLIIAESVVRVHPPLPAREGRLRSHGVARGRKGHAEIR